MPLAEVAKDADAGAFEFIVPPELEAREPAEVRGSSRDEVRLLVSEDGSGITHSRFEWLPDFLAPGDLVVLNDSKTFPASLQATRQNGESLTLHFATRSRMDTVLVEPRDATLSEGEQLTLRGAGSALILKPYRGSHRMWKARLSLPLPFFTYFARFGKPITYSYMTREWPIEIYQTVYGSVLGSAEMASAGRPFTRAMLNRLGASGVELATLTLHCSVSSPERDEAPLEEWRDVPPKTAAAVQRAQSNGGRVIAIGTTVVRALESSLDAQGQVMASRGWTNLHITPGRRLSTIDGLLTGFHEPSSTHLAMLESLVGRNHVERAYEAALEGRYLWHEFGDSHLLLRRRD